MIREIKSYEMSCGFVGYTTGDMNLLSRILFTAAVGGNYLGESDQDQTTISLDEVVSCNLELLGKLRKKPNGLWYHWSANAIKGAASLSIHGQEIEVSWWDGPHSAQIKFEVRVKNPTLETFMAIPREKLRKMRLLSTSGRYSMGLGR